MASEATSVRADHLARQTEQHTDPVEIVQRCAHRGLTLATAESLTAGSLSARIAEVPGASAVLQGGIVSYSTEVKANTLDVPRELLETRGAVDGAVAAWMARGAAQRCLADIGVSTTGVAGPTAHEGKDVGTVYLGLACTQAAAGRLGLSLPERAEPHQVHREWLTGSWLLDLSTDLEDPSEVRAAIRFASMDGALQLLLNFLNTEPAGLPERKV